MSESKYVEDMLLLQELIYDTKLPRKTKEVLVTKVRELASTAFSTGHDVGYKRGEEDFTPVMINGRPVYFK